MSGRGPTVSIIEADLIPQTFSHQWCVKKVYSERMAVGWQEQWQWGELGVVNSLRLKVKCVLIGDFEK